MGSTLPEAPRETTATAIQRLDQAVHGYLLRGSSLDLHPESRSWVGLAWKGEA